MNLTYAQTLAQTLIKAHGLHSVSFRFDRSKKRFGICMSRNGVAFQIRLSRYLVQLNTETKVRDTILHEIAHALAGVHAGHGPAWRDMARRVGARPERCYSSADVVTPAAAYTATCPACAATYSAHRLRHRQYSCTACSGGRFNPRFLLTWVKNS